MRPCGGPGRTRPRGLCEEAAVLAAQQTGVPLTVLQAIALAESGRAKGGMRRPGPGRSTSAETARGSQQARGPTGCRGTPRAGRDEHRHRLLSDQPPLAWRGLRLDDARCSTLRRMRFMPPVSCRGCMPRQATGPMRQRAYHSRTPEYAEAYRARFVDLSDGLVAGGPAPDAASSREPLSAAAGRADRRAGLAGSSTAAAGQPVSECCRDLPAGFTMREIFRPTILLALGADGRHRR